MRLLALLAALACAGCLSLPANPTEMTPDQLKEWVKDKNASVGCVVANSPYGKGNGLYLVLDKGIIPNGTVTIDDACKVVISNTAPAHTAPAPLPAK